MNTIPGVNKKAIMSPKSRPSRMKSSEAQSSKDNSKKRKHDMDNPNAEEAVKNTKKASIIRLTKQNHQSFEAVMEGKKNRMSVSSTQRDTQSSPMADKHTADVPNATVKTETMKEKAMPVLTFTDKKYSGQPKRLNSICEDKIKDNIPYEILSNYVHIDGGESDRALAHLSWICSAIKAFSSNVIRVWIGYQAHGPKHGQKYPLFVAVVKENDKRLDEKLKTVFPFTIIQRQFDQVSEEAKLCLKPENSLRYSLDEHRKLHETIIRHSDSLMLSYSNLLIVSASPIKSRKGGKDIKKQNCIVFYVHIKGIIPLREKVFPSKVGKFPVDVREGVFEKYSLTKLSLGNEIRSEYGLVGRLGGFVRFFDGKLGCFTSCHLFDTEQSRADHARDAFKPAVYQTVPGSSQRPFGKVVDLKYMPGNQHSIGVDAALIEITDRLKTPENASFRIHPDAESANPAETEFPSEEVLTSPQEIVEILYSGHAKCKIVKYNEITNRMYMRTGILNITGTTLRAWWPLNANEKCKLFSQIEIRPDSEEILDSDDKSFAKEGESGSLVFIQSNDLKNNWAIGMVVGGIKANGSGIATPIWAVLDSFNLPRRLLSFEDQRLNQVELLMKEVRAGINGLYQRVEQGFSDIQARLPHQ